MIWLCNLKSILIIESYSFRRVLLEPRAFETPKEYINEVRKYYPKANNGKGMSNTNLKCFLQHILDRYTCAEQGNVFFRASTLGYQGAHYWIFSSDVCIFYLICNTIIIQNPNFFVTLNQNLNYFASLNFLCLNK